MGSYHNQSCVLYYMTMSPYQINHQKSCGFKYKSLNKSWLPVAHCCIYYVFHLPLSAKPVSTSFGSSEGWKLHFKLLDYNLFFLGGGMPTQPIQEIDLIWTVGLLHHWQPLIEKVIEISEIHVGDRNRKS